MTETNDFQDFQDLAKREIITTAKRETTITFAREHLHEDTARLLLSATQYPGIDMPAAVQQIEGLRMAAEKWPSLLDDEEFLYPPRLNREQASSQAVAARRIAVCMENMDIGGHIPEFDTLSVADLTGGMGIDAFTLASVCKEVDYVERDPQLCALMEHNCRVEETENIRVHHADCIEWLRQQAEQHKVFDLLYIDPARRDRQGRKMVGFDSCEPNILEHMPLLRRCCRYLLVKASPMIDIDLGCRQLKHVENVFIIAHRGECKEVAFMCSNSQEPTLIHSLVADGDDTQYFCFTRKEEREAELYLAEEVEHYLYEPNVAVMKAGPFAMLCQEYEVDALAPNTHLYTSDELVPDFPGRIFEVLQEVAPSHKAIQAVLPDGKAHVVVRNFPADAATLQRQLGLREGGNLFVVATTVGSRRTAFLCRLCLPPSA